MTKNLFSSFVFPFVLLSAGLLFMLLVSASPVSAAAGAMPASVAARTFTLEPGMEKTWILPVHGSEALTVSLGGVLAPYATLQDPDPEGGPRTVSFTLRMPAVIDLVPGDHYLFLRVAEYASEATIGTQAAVNIIHIGQYYTPNPYLTAKLDAPDIEEEEPAIASFSLKSYSTNAIRDVRIGWFITANGEEVLLEGEQVILSILSPLEEKAVTVRLPAEALTPGSYELRVNLTYQGGEPIPLNDRFRIGVFNASLVSSPEVIYRGKINKAGFTIYNAWNLRIPDARVSVSIPELDIQEEAPVNYIEPFAQRLFTMYLEPPIDAELREYAGTVDLRMGIDARSQTVSFPFSVRVLDPADDAEGAARQVVEERPKAFVLTLNPLIGLYLLVLVLVFINIYFLLKQKKK